jgi:thymidylate synthase
MKVIDARNVNDAILLGVDLFNNAFNYRVQESRNGTTYEALEPVTTVYRNPCERVCLIAQRDANPFFHLIESLWMLDGRKDLNPLTHFVESMKDFSDDGKSLWGAYGWRWKSYFGRDQLPLIIDMLKKDPNDRRAVLQMWDAKEDLNRDGKDVPCNTNIYFKIRDGRLNMAVCNRSNDMLWGAYGANVVHMSILQEYMASAIGVEMGVYRQVSDSFHVYLNPVWEKVKDLTIDPHSFRHLKNPYDTLEGYTPTPLFDDVSMFNSELDRFFSMHPTNIEAHKEGWHSPIFTDIAIPMLQVHRAYQMKDFKSSYEMLESIKAFDWRAACLNWLIKREQSYLSKTQKGATHE